jgi:rfaE bifunctional protein kinase chain/domain
MTAERLEEITDEYGKLRIGLVGDLCLDRYFEIDSALQETSIETGLPVHNVTRVRCQPGAAGTILNNLVALGIGQIFPAAIIGHDGEGFELRRALEEKPGVFLDYLVESLGRRTFTYSKPLVLEKGKAPVELSRLDIKNWTPTPEPLQDHIIRAARELAPKVDALILLDQVDMPETGVITSKVLKAIADICREYPELLILADSRRSLRNYPPVSLKMNAAELAAMTARSGAATEEVMKQASLLAKEFGRYVFVTLSEKGIVGARHDGVEHCPALPVRGEIDIVGAGDSVTANLAAALAGGAKLREALEVAMLASSIVIHQLGTTGTASRKQLAELYDRSSQINRTDFA